MILIFLYVVCFSEAEYNIGNGELTVGAPLNVRKLLAEGYV